MTEAAVASKPDEVQKPSFMTVQPQEKGLPVMLYTANYGGSVVPFDAASIESSVKVSYNSPPIYVSVKGEKNRSVGSYYVRIVEAPGQPELIGKSGWLHRFEERDKDEVGKQWSTSKYSR